MAHGQGYLEKRTNRIDTIWLSPIYWMKSHTIDNGYDISDYCDIYQFFCILDDFDKPLIEYSERQLKTILDLMVNHSSNQHSWFVELNKIKNDLS